MTRAVDQIEPLAQRLRALGAEPIALSLIDIAEPSDGGAALRNALETLDTFDWLGAAWGMLKLGKGGTEPLFSVKPDVAVREHVLFDHVGQMVGRLLAVAGDAVQACRQLAHHVRDSRKQENHDQREPPVQVQQIGHEGHERQAVAGEGHQRPHQQGGAGLHFIHQGIGQGTR